MYFLGKTDFGFKLVHNEKNLDHGNKLLFNLALYCQYERYDKFETVFKIGNKSL